MVSTFTPNINLEEPARGDYVGTWDTPVNANETLTDLVVGGATTIALNNSPVILASAQFQCKTITFNSTLTGNVAITFPTSFKKSYEVYHTCTGSSAFVITLGTTAAGGQVICASPGEIIDVLNDGTNLRFKSLGRVGSYWDYAGSSVPAWVSGCTIPPYLNCDGTTFAAATFPQLAVILGSTTLPDSKGRVRATLNQGTTRLLSSNGGVDGNTNLSGGGSDGITLSASQIPTIFSGGTSSGINGGGGLRIPVATSGEADLSFSPGGSGTHVPIATGWTFSSSLSGGAAVTSTNTGGGSHFNVQPTYVAGLTLIRTG